LALSVNPEFIVQLPLKDLEIESLSTNPVLDEMEPAKDLDRESLGTKLETVDTESRSTRK
jgi:hypothetical protein